MRRCLGCMREYDAKYDVCPHCGYIYGSPAQSQNHLPPGTVLQNRYLLGKVLGQGGFGITYIAWDQKLEKAVAIKEFFPTAFASRMTGQHGITCFDAESQQLFDAGLQKMMNESRTLARFTNLKSVVQVQDCVEENGTAYIIMELLRGETVQAILKRQGQMTLEQTMDIIAPILEALEEIHQTGLVHRDVSPDNIFVCRQKHGETEPEVKLLDFGAARVANGLDNKTLSIVLKKGFAPTEQYSSRGRQGPFTDVYAVSATIYKMLTGVTPPNSLDRIGEDTLTPIHQHTEIAPQVEKVILKGMAVNAADRIQTAGELLRQLEKAIEKTEKQTDRTAGAGYAGCSPGHSGRRSAPPKNGKKRILIPAVAIAVALALIVGIVFSVRSRAPRVGETVEFGNYGAGDDAAQPLKWEVLQRDGSEALLLCCEAIDYQQYHDDAGLSFTWETSSIREWLNTVFYNAAFSEDEQKKIVLYNHDTPDNDVCKTEGCGTTADRCFLLSMQEATQYLPAGSDRKVKCTDALASRIADVGESGYVVWALRSPGADNIAESRMRFAAVDESGAYTFDNDGLQSTFIRPAIVINYKRASGDFDTDWISAYREHLYDFSWNKQDDALYIYGSGVMPRVSAIEFDDALRGSIRSATIEDGFTSLSVELFDGFSSLTSVQIPASVTQIGKSAFRGCSKLKTVYFTGSEEEKDAIEVDDGNGAFLGAAVQYTTTDETQTVSPYASLKVGDTFTFGTYEQDGVTENGKEPIEWIVIQRESDGRSVFVTTRFGLDRGHYSAEFEPVTWETSAMRKWLNGTFYAKCFTAVEQKRIIRKTVENPDNAKHKIDGGNPTDDYVFLLSIDEVTELLPRQEDRMLLPTAHAAAKGVTVVEENGGCTWWMLRSPGGGEDMCAIVRSNGDIRTGGEKVNTDTGAIRPAMWIDID